MELLSVYKGSTRTKSENRFVHQVTQIRKARIQRLSYCGEPLLLNLESSGLPEKTVHIYLKTSQAARDTMDRVGLLASPWTVANL